ncbi:hypothetical protein O6H91_02G095700 [Diphasiastrum complanatum]|uniref:Uncharacterized protein n=5 Tax=Diphasiastrum complanatum TaxID=34168 RepID=A0ACC2EIT8_DIPCM|nr:hypothetical protein O6H91_02G095700 [Diphasiastrum complanatum]KAJ7566287.1 hypothetical protein O6H91_02G095700 [Diphasiastrum complanatum]KAJ7566288.1 hypothetical protein O6H91_02G095700 [Diphasiastrum complanatum]KAJ7566289.1 hypothetical protein O6H91_02G095700 [Diphasiastrum complanatum]KAJ7566290.1 hypothetical protein O6H91_02G095700 [Diphasiastrum complanatum]
MATSKQRFVLGRQSSLAPEESSGSSTSDGELTSAEQLDQAIQLLYLASKGDVDGVKCLLDSGVDVNSKDFDGRTALHLAACEGQKEVVELLVHKGADVNATDRWGSTPLADARHYNNTDVCRFLESCGTKNTARSRIKAPLELLSTKDIPDYEINPAEIKEISNYPEGKDTYILAEWRGTKVFLKKICQDVLVDDHAINAFKDELSLLLQLRHPNVVQFLGAVTQSTPLTIIIEYLPKGNLHDYMKGIGRPLKPVKAVKLALDIARGMNYLHERKPDAIIHRNLTPSNLWRDKACHLKVGEFGFSKRLNMASDSVRETEEGLLSGSSCRYMAPELFRLEAHDRKVDVFSFGLILQEMIEGSPPLVDQSPEEAAAAYAHRDLRPPFKVKSKYYPTGLKELIEECWDKDPKKRPSFAKIIIRLETIKRECTEKRSFQRFITHIKYSKLLTGEESI